MKGINSCFERMGAFGMKTLSACSRLTGKLEENRLFRTAVFAGLLVLIGAIVFLLNSHTPLMMDDYDYSFSMSTGRRIESPVDVIGSQIAHYKIWGGRSVVHAVAQVFLGMDKMVFNIANTLMYLLLLLEISAIAGPSGRRLTWTLLLAAHMVLFFFVPFFGTVFLWLDGACNYLFGTALALCPILLHRSALEIGVFASGRKKAVFAVLICFLAGWTNENTACGVFAVVFLMTVSAALRGRRVAPWQWAALPAQLLGIAVMLLAPGNFARAATLAQRPFLMEMAYRLIVVTAYFFVYCGGLTAVLIFALSISAKLHTGGIGRALVLFFGAVITAYALIGSPVVSDRSYTGVIVLALCAVLALLGEFEHACHAFDAQKILVLPILVLLVAYGGYKALGDVSAHEAAWNVQTARIEAAKEQGESGVQLQSVPSVSPYTFSVKLEKEADVWPNSTLRKYFGIEITGE